MYLVLLHFLFFLARDIYQHYYFVKSLNYFLPILYIRQNKLFPLETRLTKKKGEAGRREVLISAI